jgi:threonine dehydratase
MTVVFADILAAAHRLEGHAHRTPVITSRRLNERVGAEVCLKCESLQRGGAFKFRGAYNAISQLSYEEMRRGVITYSSGNHAQATALVGSLLGVQTIVVMPDNAPASKRAATESYGAKVVAYNPEEADRMELAHQLAQEQGYTIVPPYNDRRVVAGQGTAALELLREVGEMNMLLVPCGGGGLLSGSAIAAKGLQPGCKVIGIEPELADDAVRSFRSGTLQTVHNPPTIADGARTPSLGDVTFPLVMEFVDDMASVNEQAITDAVRFAFTYTKLVIEPTGALALAALLSGAIQPIGRVGVIISGGNVDGATMAKILTGAL